MVCSYMYCCTAVAVGCMINNRYYNCSVVACKSGCAYCVVTTFSECKGRLWEVIFL